jgi:hypothetical protein
LSNGERHAVDGSHHLGWSASAPADRSASAAVADRQITHLEQRRFRAVANPVARGIDGGVESDCSEPGGGLGRGLAMMRPGVSRRGSTGGTFVDRDALGEMTGHQALISYRRQAGLIMTTAIDGDITSRTERASQDLVVQSGRRPRYGYRLLASVQICGSSEQAAGVGMVRLGDEQPGRAGLDDLPGIHHRHLLADLGHDGQIMRDEYQAQTSVAREVDEELDDLGLYHHVEGGCRFVGEEHPRPTCQGHGQTGSLAHPSGELVGIPRLGCHWQADKVEELPSASLACLVGGRLMEPQRLCDLVTDGRDGIEGVHRSLKDDRKVRPTVGAGRVLAFSKDLVAVQQDVPSDAGGRWQETHEGEDGAALATTRFSD